MANAQVLQNAVNRFASAAGFVPLAVDGIVGQKTLSATNKALEYVSIEVEGGPIPPAVSEQASAFATNAARSSAVLAANADQVGAFLNYVADLVHLAPVYGPQIVPTTNAAVATSAGVFPPLPTNGMATSILTSIKALPTWQKVALGALGVIGALAAAHKIKARSGTLY